VYLLSCEKKHTSKCMDYIRSPEYSMYVLGCRNDPILSAPELCFWQPCVVCVYDTKRGAPSSHKHCIYDMGFVIFTAVK